MSHFGKMAFLLTSKANQVYAGQVSHQIWDKLLANETIIKNAFGAIPKGYILVTDTHPSKSDARSHFTIDAYGKDANGLDIPIGCIHMYDDFTFKLYTAARSKALEAYLKKLYGLS